MNYDNFKQQILSGLKERLPNATLSIEPVLKNNAVHLDGLIILENETNISPTLYLNYYYDIYFPYTVNICTFKKFIHKFQKKEIISNLFL